MTAPHIVDPERLLREAIGEASPDLLRHLLQTVINALLSADADAVCGAEYGTASDTRTAQRNGYRHRPLDTRAGTIDVAIPKLRAGIAQGPVPEGFDVLIQLGGHAADLGLRERVDAELSHEFVHAAG